MRVSFEFEGKSLNEIGTMMHQTAEELLKKMDAEKPAKKAKKGKPEPTVSEDEDEDFGKKPLKKKDVKADDEDDEEEDDSEGESEESDEDEESEGESEESDEDEESEDDATGVSFDELKKAINKYGEKKPEDMKAILLGFNIKNTKELKLHGKKWEAVYRKVMAKMKALKK